jgi:hypothetical protein
VLRNFSSIYVVLGSLSSRISNLFPTFSVPRPNSRPTWLPESTDGVCTLVSSSTISSTVIRGTMATRMPYPGYRSVMRTSPRRLIVKSIWSLQHSWNPSPSHVKGFVSYLLVIKSFLPCLGMCGTAGLSQSKRKIPSILFHSS